jgi:hypothetical protein
MLGLVYPQELLDLCSGNGFDRNAAKSLFLGKGVGESAASNMTALFVLLKSGEVKEKKDRNQTVAKKTTQNPKATSGKSSSQTAKQQDVPQQSVGEQSVATNPATSNRPNLHIDLQIHISPESTPEQIDSIFASMAKHLYGVDNS